MLILPYKGKLHDDMRTDNKNTLLSEYFLSMDLCDNLFLTYSEWPVLSFVFEFSAPKSSGTAL